MNLRSMVLYLVAHIYSHVVDTSLVFISKTKLVQGHKQNSYGMALEVLILEIL